MRKIWFKPNLWSAETQTHTTIVEILELTWSFSYPWPSPWSNKGEKKIDQKMRWRRRLDENYIHTKIIGRQRDKNIKQDPQNLDLTFTFLTSVLPSRKRVNIQNKIMPLHWVWSSSSYLHLGFGLGLIGFL